MSSRRKSRPVERNENAEAAATSKQSAAKARAGGPIRVRRLDDLTRLETALRSAGDAAVASFVQNATHTHTHTNPREPLTAEERVLAKAVMHQLAEQTFKHVRVHCYADADEPEPVDTVLEKRVRELQTEVAAADKKLSTLRQQHASLASDAASGIRSRARVLRERVEQDLAVAGPTAGKRSRSRAGVDADDDTHTRTHTHTHDDAETRKADAHATARKHALETAVAIAMDVCDSLRQQGALVDDVLTNATHTLTVAETVRHGAPSSVDLALRRAGAAETKPSTATRGGRRK